MSSSVIASGTRSIRAYTAAKEKCASAHFCARATAASNCGAADFREKHSVRILGVAMRQTIREIIAGRSASTTPPRAVRRPQRTSPRPARMRLPGMRAPRSCPAPTSLLASNMVRLHRLAAVTCKSVPRADSRGSARAPAGGLSAAARRLRERAGFAHKPTPENIARRETSGAYSKQIQSTAPTPARRQSHTAPGQVAIASGYRRTLAKATPSCNCAALISGLSCNTCCNMGIASA